MCFSRVFRLTESVWTPTSQEVVCPAPPIDHCTHGKPAKNTRLGKRVALRELFKSHNSAALGPRLPWSLWILHGCVRCVRERNAPRALDSLVAGSFSEVQAQLSARILKRAKRASCTSWWRAFGPRWTLTFVSVHRCWSSRDNSTELLW